jgi:hypothetical protein
MHNTTSSGSVEAKTHKPRIRGRNTTQTTSTLPKTTPPPINSTRIYIQKSNTPPNELYLYILTPPSSTITKQKTKETTTLETHIYKKLTIFAHK